MSNLALKGPQLRQTVCYRPTVYSDVEHVAPRVRAADIAECAAIGVHDMHEALTLGVRKSVLCWTATADDEPVFIMGVTPLQGLLGDTGVPWLLGTNLVRQHALALMRPAPAYIAQMLGLFPHLMNFVHVENKVSVGWLRRMGFTLADPAPYGPHGALFHRFEAFNHVSPRSNGRNDGAERCHTSECGSLTGSSHSTGSTG